MKNILKFMERHFGIVVSSGIVLGMVLGDVVVFNPDFLSVLLMLMILLAALKTDLFSIGKYLKKPFWLILLSVLKLVVLPLFVFITLAQFFPDFQTGLILLSAIPAAVAAPGIIVLIKGDIKLGLLVAVFTNLLVPITAPFILYYTVGAEVDIDILSMFLFLAMVVLLPLFLAFLLEKFSPRVVKNVNKNSGGILALLVFIFMVAAIAPNQKEILSDLPLSFSLLGMSVVLFLFLGSLTYLMFIKVKKSLLGTNIVLLTFTNAGLAVVLAAQYFDTSTLLMSVFYELPWALGLIPLQLIFRK